MIRVDIGVSSVKLGETRCAMLNKMDGKIRLNVLQERPPTSSLKMHTIRYDVITVYGTKEGEIKTGNSEGGLGGKEEAKIRSRSFSAS